MHVLKNILTAITALLLHLTLPLLVIASIFTLLFTTPDTIKQSFREADVYQAFVDTIAHELTAQTQTDGSSDIPQKEMRNAIEQAVTAEDVQTQAEQAIDGVYDWLNGTTEQPEFMIDFGPARERFAEEIAMFAAERLQSLPTCTSLDQLQGEIDPLTTECLPPGFDPIEKTSTYADELLASDDFIPDVQISSTELLDDIEDDDQISTIPEGFEWLMRSIWIISTAIVVLALGLFALAPSKQVGVRRVGMQFFIAGLWLGLSTLIVWILQDGLFKENAAAAEIQNALARAGELLVGDILLIMAVGAGIYVLLGLSLRYGLAPRLKAEEPAVDKTGRA